MFSSVKIPPHSKLYLIVLPSLYVHDCTIMLIIQICLNQSPLYSQQFYFALFTFLFEFKHSTNLNALRFPSLPGIVRLTITTFRQPGTLLSTASSHINSSTDTSNVLISTISIRNVSYEVLATFYPTIILTEAGTTTYTCHHRRNFADSFAKKSPTHAEKI